MVAAAIAPATVGLAGAPLAMRATLDPYAGPAQLIFAFEAAVIGGAGSLWGTLAGGIVMGVAQSVGAQISPQGTARVDANQAGRVGVRRRTADRPAERRAGEEQAQPAEHTDRDDEHQRFEPAKLDVVGQVLSVVGECAECQPGRLTFFGSGAMLRLRASEFAIGI